MEPSLQPPPNKRQRTRGISTSPATGQLLGVSGDVASLDETTPPVGRELLGTTSTIVAKEAPITNVLQTRGISTSPAEATGGLLGVSGDVVSLDDTTPPFGRELLGTTNTSTNAANEVPMTTVPPPPTLIVSSPPPPPPQVSYWDSPKAKKLFNSQPSEANALAAVEKQIDVLTIATQSYTGYFTIIHNLNEINEDDITHYQNGSFNRSHSTSQCRSNLPRLT